MTSVDGATVALLTVNGLVWGLVLALMALGLALIFGLTEVLNLAHGEFYMWGAVLGWFVIQWCGSFWLALVVVPLIAAVAGLVIERLLLRKVEHQIAPSLLVTFGLALVLQRAALLIFGGSPQRMQPPEGYEGTCLLFGFGYPKYRLLVAGIAALVLLSTWLFVHRTRFGLWMRAVRQHPELALGLGIPVHRVYWITFGLGTGCAALAGLLVAPIVAVEFRMGLEMLPLAFMAVIVGGMGDLKGAVLASLFLGVVEGLMTVVATPMMARIMTLMLVATILLVWPKGLTSLLARFSRETRRHATLPLWGRQ